MVLPTATPVTRPEEALITATEGLELLHTPPGAPSLKDIVPGRQSTVGPVILPATGNGFTVTTAVAA